MDLVEHAVEGGGETLNLLTFVADNNPFAQAAFFYLQGGVRHPFDTGRSGQMVFGTILQAEVDGSAVSAKAWRPDVAVELSSEQLG